MRKKIIFCGTPYFAKSTLDTLFKLQEELNYDLVGVVTIKDKISGRGQKKQESTIKKTAKILNLKIFTPDNLEDLNFIKKIKKLNPDLIIVVAFKKLPKIFFSIPKLGTINLHASLLPKYRGAAPINWALINGEKKTGLTTFFINEKIDTGDVILQSEIKILKNWHANDLHDKLMVQSEGIIKETLKIIFFGNYKLKKQNLKSRYKGARKILKSDYQFPKELWKQKSLQDLFNFIRGMSPPGIRTNIRLHRDQPVDKKIIITRVCDFKKHKNKTQIKDISIQYSKENRLTISNNIESFIIEKLKIENKKEMTDKEFYNGYIKNKNQNYKISIII